MKTLHPKGSQKNGFPVLHDISVAVGDRTPIWPGANRPSLKDCLRIQKSDLVNDSDFHFNLHTATHLEIPLHYYDHSPSIDQYPLHRFIGACYVIDCEQAKRIEPVMIETKLKALGFDPSRDIGNASIRKILFKTTNSMRWDEPFFEDFVGLSVESSQWLVQHGFDLVGNDYLSVQPYGGDPEVHRILMKKDCVILEGIRLLNVPEGIYQLHCVPIKIEAAEASPCRAYLIEI